MKLNVGCGLDVREGWVNVDVVAPAELPGSFALADARDLGAWFGHCELVLLNHVLHLFDYDDADRVLAQCAKCLEPGGELVIVDADVLGVLVDDYPLGPTVAEGLISTGVEPTAEGRVLRWVTWHGTRRSLWSYQSLAPRLEALGLWSELGDDEWADPRQAESFVVVGHKSS